MHSDPQRTAVFSALADPTRRAILAKLAQGEATVAQLGGPFHLAQPTEIGRISADPTPETRRDVKTRLSDRCAAWPVLREVGGRLARGR